MKNLLRFPFGTSIGIMWHRCIFLGCGHDAAGLAVYPDGTQIDEALNP
jgi:hypothetical protein